MSAIDVRASEASGLQHTKLQRGEGTDEKASLRDDRPEHGGSDRGHRGGCRSPNVTVSSTIDRKSRNGVGFASGSSSADDDSDDAAAGTSAGGAATNRPGNLSDRAGTGTHGA